MKRQESLQTVGGAAVIATATVGITVAQEGGGGAQVQPNLGGYLDGVDGGYEDLRSQSEVTIEIGTSGNGGSLASVSADIWIDPGATVTWGWTGEGGGHNVIASEGASLDSGAAIFGTGSTYEHTFESGDTTRYHCVLCEALGILDAVAVGDDVATINIGGDGEKELHGFDVPIQAHWVGSVMILGALVTIIYTFLILKHDESPNTGSTGGDE